MHTGLNSTDDTTEITNGFSNSRQRIFHVFFKFYTATTCVFNFK